MLACIACSKHADGSLEPVYDDDGGTPRSPGAKDAIKSLTNQLKGMATRFSTGAYRHCRPCTTAGLVGIVSHHDYTSSHAIDSMDILDASSEFSVGSSRHNSNGGSTLSSHYSTPAQSFKGTPSRSRRESPPTHIQYTRHRLHEDSNSSKKYKGAHVDLDNNWSKKRNAHNKGDNRDKPQKSDANGDPRLDHQVQLNSKTVCEEEHVEVEKEWVAQVEPGVLITFVTLIDGANDLKRIRFSREMFNKWQAQQWWAENCDKVHELYNVPKFNRMPGSLPTPSRSEDESCKSRSSGEYKKDGPSGKQREAEGKKERKKGGHGRGGSMVGEMMGATDMSSACASEWEAASEDDVAQHHSHVQQCGNSIDKGPGEEEWIHEDEPGVYITLVSCNGSTELKRIRFSREKFSEIQARIWWEENRIRVYEHYL